MSQTRGPASSAVRRAPTASFCAVSSRRLAVLGPFCGSRPFLGSDKSRRPAASAPRSSRGETRQRPSRALVPDAAAPPARHCCRCLACCRLVAAGIDPLEARKEERQAALAAAAKASAARSRFLRSRRHSEKLRLLGFRRGTVGDSCRQRARVSPLSKPLGGGNPLPRPPNRGVARRQQSTAPHLRHWPISRSKTSMSFLTCGERPEARIRLLITPLSEVKRRCCAKRSRDFDRALRVCPDIRHVQLEASLPRVFLQDTGRVHELTHFDQIGADRVVCGPLHDIGRFCEPSGRFADTSRRARRPARRFDGEDTIERTGSGTLPC